MDHPYVITGAGGRTGSAAARFLLETGAPVRVVLRDPAKAAEWVRLGAEVAIADLTNPAAMSGAFANARGAYVVSPQEYERDDLFERADVCEFRGMSPTIPSDVAHRSEMKSPGWGGCCWPV